MTKPVTGFLAEDGTFFDNERAAQGHDATNDFNKHLGDYLSRHGFATRTHSFVMDLMRHFMIANKEAVHKYAMLVDDVPPEPSLDDERRDFGQPRTTYKDPDPTAPVVYFDLGEEPENINASLHTDFISAFEDPVGEDDTAGEEEGVDGKIRLDGVHSESIY